MECKAALSLKKKHFANLLQYLRLSGQKRGILISAAPYSEFSFEDDKTIINIPIYLLTEKNVLNYLNNSLPERSSQKRV